MFGRRKGTSQPAPEDPAELYARARELRKDYRNADEVEALLTRAGELGHKVASCDLGVLLERQSRFDEALRWFETARDQGHVLAERMLSDLAAKRAKSSAGDGLDALEARAQGGDREAMLALGRRLIGLSRRTQATVWLARAAEAGYRPAVRELAGVQAQDGHLDAAEDLLRGDATYGDIDGVGALAEFLRAWRRGGDELPALLQRLIDLGEPWAPVRLARLCAESGDQDAAERWYRTALPNAETSSTASAELGALLLDLGRTAEAETLLRHSAGMGDFHLAWLLESRGDDDGAEPLYRDLAESDIDQVDAAAGLARILERRGAAAEARQWREQAEGVNGAVPPGPGGA